MQGVAVGSDRIGELIESGEAGLTKLIETEKDAAVRCVCLLKRAEFRQETSQMGAPDVEALLRAAVSDYEEAARAAIEADHRAVQLEAMVNLPQAFGLLARHADARAAAAKALAFIRPDDPRATVARHTALKMRGTAAFFEGDFAAAAADYEAALQEIPAEHAIASDLGEALVELARYDEALSAFDRAIEGEVATELTFVGRGIANERLGNIEAARADYRRALQIAPTNAAANDGLVRLD